MSFAQTTCFCTDLSESDWAEILQVTQAAFMEHRAKGVNMALCDITLEQLKVFLRDCQIFIIRDGGRIIAYRGGKLVKNAGSSYFMGQSVSVLPEYKGKGLGKRLHLALEKFAVDAGCTHLVTDTSCKAKSSQAYHRACGFKSWYFTHYAQRNYRSIVFRKELRGSYPEYKRWKTLIKSWISVHLKFRHDGEYTCLYALINRLRELANKPPKNAELLSLEEVQKVALRLLVQFDELCRRHHLRYFLCYGSLIGAVRHKGFIPWDDDIDVAMPLPDYEKLLRHFGEFNEDADIDLLYGMKRNVGIPFAMLVDKNTLTVTPGRDRKHSHPLAIDIFPVFALSDEEEVARKQIDEVCDKVKESHVCLRAPSCLHVLRRLKFNLCAPRKLRRILDDIYSAIHRCPWGSTRQIRIMSLEERERLALSSDAFEQYILMEFEGHQVRVPASYHDHLKEVYGDYMTLPPVESRHGLLSKVYRLRK